MAIRQHVKTRPIPQGLAAEARRFVTDLWSLIVGLSVTERNFLKSQKTVHYPRQVIPTDRLDGFRGHIELAPNAKDPSKPLCKTCMLCAKACPSSCIDIHVRKVELEVEAPSKPERKAIEIPGDGMDMTFETPKQPQKKKKKTIKELVSFTLDFSLCSLCGQCVQNCKVGAIRHSRHIYLAGTTREEFNMDLLSRFHQQAGTQGGVS